MGSAPRDAISIVAAGRDRIDDLGPIWESLSEHHRSIAPELAALETPRVLAESWAVRRGEYEKLMAGEDFFVFLAEVRSLPVGYALVHMRGDETESGAVAELETLTVLPEHRGRGIGATLYEAVLAELRRRHVGRISVSAIASNEGAIRFYERQGLLPYMRSFVGSVAGLE